jgi:hypothetical protein
MNAQLSESLKKTIGSKVIVMDDAFNSYPILADLDDTDIAAFTDILGKDAKAHDWVKNGMGKDFDASQAETELEDEDVLQMLWSKRSEASPAKGALDALFKGFAKDVDEKKQQLRPLTQYLREKLSLDVVELQAPQEGVSPLHQDHADCRLVFLDYFLTPDQGEEAITNTIKRIRSIYDGFKAGARPIVILMSSHNIGAAQRRQFRDEVGVLGSHFRFLYKPELKDETRIALTLSHLLETYAGANKIDQLLGQWEVCVGNATQSALKTLRSLDFADYAFLDNFRLSAEGMNLGTYIATSFAEFLVAKIESEKATVDLINQFDSLDLNALAPVSLVPSDEIAELYHALVFTNIRAKVRPADSDKGELRVMFGDTFVQKTESGQHAVIVITPACDLIRAPKDTTVMLLQGEVVDKDNFAKGQDPVLTDLLSEEGGKYVIQWDLKQPTTLEKQRIEPWFSPEQTTRFVGRLRALYAIELQQRFSAGLTRIGKPAEMHSYKPVSVKAYCKRKNDCGARRFTSRAARVADRGEKREGNRVSGWLHRQAAGGGLTARSKDRGT